MSKARKRQKVEHVSSNDDDASFASFSDGASTSNNDDDDYDGVEQHGPEDLEDEEHSLGSSDQDEMGDKQDDAIDQASVVERKAKTNGHGNAIQRTSASQTIPSRKSSIFSAQVVQLLKQIRPKHTAREVEAEEALHMVKSTIDAIPAQGPFPIVNARKVLGRERVVIPFPSPAPTDDSNLKFAYQRPTSINVVGSYPMKTASRARKFLYVDMVALMPASLFTDKDCLDYRYFHKRAFYLAVLASALRAAHEKNLDIRFQCHHDDLLRPIITIRPRVAPQSGDPATPTRKWQINILPAIPEDLFAPAKLLPSVNCVRKGRTGKGATPFYNSSIRADMLVTAYLKLLHKASTTCEAFKDVCSLGSSWLRQRGFRATSRKGGIASFEWSALVALLLTAGGPGGRPVLSERWESLQLFKATLQFLATKDLSKHPVSVGIGQNLDTAGLEVPVLWDAARAHNIFHKLTMWSYKRLQSEARLTMTLLGNEQYNGFEATFIMRKDVDLLDHDCVVELHLGKTMRLATASESYDLWTKLYNVLRRGLGDRVKSVQLSGERSKPWELNAQRPANADLIKIGLVVNPDTVPRGVDHGPSVEDKAASASFREFWGDKSELRRFKDGSITEALIWETGPGATPVLQQVVRYILRSHIGVEAETDVLFNADMQTQLLSPRARDAQAGLEAFKTLEQDVRGLEGLPLPIRQFVPAAIGMISPKKHASVTPRDVVLQFESSGRWPDNLAAIQRTKIAFLLKISELLQGTGKSASSRVGLENEEHDIRNQGFLDVVYDAASAYRIRIFHDREQTLLERQLKDKSLDAQSVELAAAALAVYKRNFLKRPAHTQAMTQLCSRYPALRGTIDLLEQWMSQHVLVSHFATEVIELLVARTFLQPWPWQTPNTVQTGFLRTLAWLARWDWRVEPLIIDMSSTRDLKAAAAASIRTRFEAWRKLDPACNRVAIFAASNVDDDGTTYTIDRPSKVVVSRLVALARAASDAVQAQGLKLDHRTLFSSSLADFDFVLHLNVLPQGKANAKTSGFKNLELAAASDAGNVGFAPVDDFLAELQTAYGSAVWFFSGYPHRAAISGVWASQTADRPWKVNLAYSTIPVAQTDATLAQINKSAMLSEIARLGGDLVERVEVMKK